MEDYSCPFSRRRRLGNSSLQNGYKNGASYDQDERQSDGSMHWDTIGPVLLKAFAKHGARDVSEKYWFFLIHEGSSKARIEYCEYSTKSIANFRAIQGHSGGIPIDPELMGYVRISDDCKKYFDHRGCSVSIQSILEAWQRRDKKKENPWIKEYSRAWIHKKWTLWCRLQDKHLETVCGKAFRTSSHCPRLFNSQGYASWHRSGAGYRLVWNTRPNLTRMTVLEIPSHYAENAQFSRANPQSRFFFCSNSWRNHHWTSHWSSHRKSVWHPWTWKSKVHLQIIQNRHLGFWLPEERVDSWNGISQMANIISNIVRKSLDSTTCAKSRTHKQFAIAAAAAVDLRGRDLHKESLRTTGRG